MKKSKQKIVGIVVLFVVVINCHAQNTLRFTGVKATSEKAIQLFWASNTNDVYEVDYADQLAGNDDGSTAWNKLYDEYPSHGTNTFIADAGNYEISPEISHPKQSPMRFYRIMLAEGNTIATNPVVSILAPTNGASLSGDAIVLVSASSGDILTDVKLYVDGEEQWKSADGTNFLINTCEWPNGSHTIFATAKSQSGFEGFANGGVISYGRAVSSYRNVTFDNLITRFDFSQIYFEPDLGQTQQVTAAFTANCDWTLQIQNASSNTVRHASGSGSSMQFDWDGTGDGSTNIPNGVYTYLLTAQTNGQAFMSMMWSGGGSFNAASEISAISEEPTELWALSPESSSPPLPLAIYPPGFNTNGFEIFEATPSEVRALTRTVMSIDRSVELSQSTTLMESESSGGGMLSPAAAYSSPSQSTTAPKRKPKTGVKGLVGTFGICYKTYGTNGFSSAHPPTGWPFPLPTLVAVDNQSRTAQTVDWRISEFKYIANDFAANMKKAAWKAQFIKADDQWGATDIKKTSLGGSSIFNTCNFGLLMTHGSFGNTGSTGTENDNIRYTYSLMGANDRVRLSDMDFGNDGTNGLKWMTIYACNILKSENYNSMNNAGKIPVNENLHLLLGPSSFTYACSRFGDLYAHFLTESKEEIVTAFNHAGQAEADFNQRYLTNSITFAVSGWQACLHDKLTASQDPDPNNGLQYQQTTIFTYPH